MRSLIVFDLDGTLIDSRQDLADATNAMIVEQGGRPLAEDQVAAMVGDGAAVLVRRALAAARLDADPGALLERFLIHYRGRLTRHTRAYEGIPEVLATLGARGHTLAVLTNKPQELSERILDELGLAPAFAGVTGGDTAAGRKPDPTGLLQLVARFEATPGSTMLVGDSPVDLETARRAGTGICLARYGFGYRFPDGALRGDELAVDRPADLPDLLASR